MKVKRGQVVRTTGKTRITIYLDDAILEQFRRQSAKTGKGYQTLINEALIWHLASDYSLTPDVVRRIVREELAGTH